MRLVKLTTCKKTNTLLKFPAGFLYLSCLVLIFILTSFYPAFSQDNSPYSRYGIGDLVPSVPVTSRAMGGIAAGYNDVLSINFSNPASYSSFQAGRELKSKRMTSGRAILDIGVNFENRTLQEPGNSKKFVANNALFSHIQVGVPIKTNWGISFGLRPLSRISYKIIQAERLKDPITGLPIDSASTRFEGTGGAYLASFGTGFNLFRRDKKNSEEKLSVGINAGYLFGTKDYSTKRSLLNDTINYYQANYETKMNYRGLYASAGVQYKVPLNNKIIMTLGAFGNWGQTFNASENVLRETFYYDETLGDVRLDSVSDQKNVKGKLILPASYTFGFVLQKMTVQGKEGGWLLGADFSQQKWNDYRYYGKTDSVKNNWLLKAGGQLNPVPKRNYFSFVSYRLGFFIGTDYVKVGKTLSQAGATFGLGLPLAINRQAPNQSTLVNLAFEYSKRGKNTNLLRENMFRFSLGFSLSDIWFIKRKYE